MKKLGLITLAIAATLAGLACSSSTSDSGTGTDGGTTTTGDGSSTTTGDGSTTTNTDGGSGGNKCGSMSGSTGSCTQAQIDEYANCAPTKCDSQYQMCAGADYKTGKFSGVCGDYFTCTNACACGDTACITACKPSTDCTSCFSTLTNCITSMCPLPACASATGDGGLPTGDGGAGKTCADLTTCCSGITDMTNMMACTSIAGMGVDLACNAAYTTFACK